jgi:hypothetical protein
MNEDQSPSPITSPNIQPPPTNVTQSPLKPHSNNILRKWVSIGLALMTVIILSLTGILIFKNKPLSVLQTKNSEESAPHPTQQPINQNATIVPTNYSDFQEDINDDLEIDLKQVKYYDDYVSYLKLNEDAQAKLSKYGFTVENKKRSDPEFFEYYKTNKWLYYANFITTDSVLHLLHKHFEYLLKRSEENNLLPLLENVTSAGLSQAKAQYESDPNSDYNKIAYSYFLIGATLLNLNVAIPSELQTYINQEIDLIENGNQILDSVVLNLDHPSDPKDVVKMDYSQYTVRGYYNENDNLKRYFKGYMWLSLPAINLQSDRGMSLSQHLTKILLSGQQAMDSYHKIVSFVGFFTNIPCNVSVDKMNDLGIINNNDLSTILQTLLNDKNNPLETDNDYLKFSYFPRASLLDNYIFQNDDKKKIVKLFPSTIEIPTVYGSKEAKNIAEKIGFTTIYGNNDYFSHLEKIKNSIINNQNNLYGQWMTTLNPLLDYPKSAYIFSGTRAWLRKELVTYLSSWTELRHSMILYVKASGGGGGGEPPKRDDRGLVEPYPEVYQGIIANIDYILSHFQNNNLLDSEASRDFTELKSLVQKLYEIALKENNNQTLSTENYDFIRNYGDAYQELWLKTFTEKQRKESTLIDLMNDNPAALVVDVDADEIGQILHSGNGFAQKITVIFKLEEEMRFATGLVYSNYEFKQQNKRLTDEEWRKMLRSTPADGQNYYDFENTPWQKIYQFAPSKTTN